MSRFQSDPLIRNLTDEEFMKEAYLKGFGNLDSSWVAELFYRLERALDEKDGLVAEEDNA